MKENVAKSYSEVNVILLKLDKKYYNKISKGFLNFINANEDKEYKTYFANNENNIKISKYTQALLALSKSKGGSFEIEYNIFKNQGKNKKNAYKLKEITKEEFIKWLNKQ